MPFKYPGMRARLNANSAEMRVHAYDPAKPWTAWPCRCWIRKESSSGYGVLTVRTRVRYKEAWHKRCGQRKVRTIYAHRVSLADALDLPMHRIPLAMHKCDVKLCIEPEHLEKATPTRNNRDTVKKGRHRNGHTTEELSR